MVQLGSCPVSEVLKRTVRWNDFSARSECHFESNNKQLASEMQEKIPNARSEHRHEINKPNSSYGKQSDTISMKDEKKMKAMRNMRQTSTPVFSSSFHGVQEQVDLE
jgi:hypothetical protein